MGEGGQRSTQVEVTTQAYVYRVILQLSKMFIKIALGSVLALFWWSWLNIAREAVVER